MAQLHETQEDHGDCDYLELPNTSIFEMEAENISELSAEWAIQSQELPDSSSGRNDGVRVCADIVFSLSG